jgi:hypothetical protein
VGHRRHHVRRLADDAQPGLEPGLLQVGDERTRAEAAHLLVVAERVVHGKGQVRGQEVMRLRHRQADEALHVGAAAAVQAGIAQLGRQRVHAPGLSVPGHRVGVTRQDHTAGLSRADRGKEVGLPPFLVVGEPDRDVERAQVVGDALDQRQVRVGADRAQAHQALRPLQRVVGQGRGQGGVHAP